MTTMISEAPMIVIFLSFTATLILATPPWPDPYWDIPGDYCKAKYPEGRCCQGRNDPCSVPILGTLCYCDTFCNRTGNSDCCPDYFTHCEGLSTAQYFDAKPEEYIKPSDLVCYGLKGGTIRRDNEEPTCDFQGKTYSIRDVIMDNCNVCKCEISMVDSRCMEITCESKDCLVDKRTLEELEEGYNSGQYSWKPVNNASDFWGKSLQQGYQLKLGTIRPEKPVSVDTSDMSAIRFKYKPSDFPKHFDSRIKWPGRIQSASNQGWCGASWAFSTISVVSDRFAIEEQSNEAMSVQTLLSCNTKGQFGCRGGHVDRAWNYIRRYGIVPESCYPFEDFEGYETPERRSGKCRVPRSRRFNVVRALGSCSSVKRRRDMFRAQPAYKVGRRNTSNKPRRREMDIMYEIMLHGPVQALMEVPSDFFSYESGIYHKTNLAIKDKLGFHSVKIIGWGEENSTPYWLCVNSWGTDWGENGTFKILRGSNECQIENFVVGVWSQTNKRFRSQEQRKRMRERRRLSQLRRKPTNPNSP